MEPSDATLHLQAFSTLAYGGRGIEYFTFFTRDVGNYRLGAVDQYGEPTPTWEILRRLNRQIHAMAPTLVKLHSAGVVHSPDIAARSRLVQRVNTRPGQDFYSDPALLPKLREKLSDRFLIGEFSDDGARDYLMVVNKDLARSLRFELELKRPGRLVRISPYSGQEAPFTGEQTWLAPGHGVLLRVDR